MASLVETCKLNKVGPQRYFTELLTRLVNGWPQARINELMPWCWADEGRLNVNLENEGPRSSGAQSSRFSGLA